MLPKNVGTAGPWSACGRPAITREVVGNVYQKIADDGPVTAAGLAKTAEQALGYYSLTGSSRELDIILQLLKRWRLIRFEKGSGWVATPERRTP